MSLELREVRTKDINLGVTGYGDVQVIGMGQLSQEHKKEVWRMRLVAFQHLDLEEKRPKEIRC